MEYFSEFGYSGLFVAAFLAATILPLSSEVVLTALIITGLEPLNLVLVAATGNVLGSLLNYGLGYWLSLDLVKKWLRISEQDYLQAEKRFEKYGLFSLLFAWVPIIGDPITLIAGVMRIRLAWFIVLVAIGKLGRYSLLSYLVVQGHH